MTPIVQVQWSPFIDLVSRGKDSKQAQGTVALAALTGPLYQPVMVCRIVMAFGLLHKGAYHFQHGEMLFWQHKKAKDT